MQQLIEQNTEADECFSVAKCSDGEYGIDENLIFSYPSRMVNGQLQVIEGMEHSAFAQEKIQATKDELLSEHDAVKKLGLI